jgi:hypothetical protein
MKKSKTGLDHAELAGLPDFEKFLAELSARFVALPPDMVDEEIENAFKEILVFFNVDRSSLLRLPLTKKHIRRSTFYLAFIFPSPP